MLEKLKPNLSTMKYRLRYLVAMALLAVSIAVQAETVTIHGTVRSASTGEELIGAAVASQATGQKVVTDIDGKYTLKAEIGGVIEVSYVGFKPKSVTVKKAGELNIDLAEDSKVLDEVVVVGYGAMKRSDLTGAVSSINEEAIKQGVNTSIEQAMQGRIAGVQVTQNSGAPGGGISVQIRGINSLNGNEPLYVIDGVAVSGQTSDDSSVLASINPSDIVSVEVLKDASATAIYGSQASNGVVLITTRQGEEGKPRITYEGYVGWQQLPTRVNTMNLREYAEFCNIRADLRGWGQRTDFADPSLLSNGTDWQSEIFRTAFMQNHQANITGGFAQTKYSISGGFLDQDGIGLGSNFRRASFRVNFDTEIKKWLSVGVRASYTNKKQITTLSDNSLLKTALDQRPDVAVRNPDGTYVFMQTDDTGEYVSNPVFEAMMRENYNTGSQFYYNVFADIKPIKGLNLRVEYGGNNSRNNTYYYQPNYTYGKFIIESESRRSASKNDSWSFKTYATYDFQFAKYNKVQLMVGHEAQHGKWENLYGARKGFISDAIHSLDVGDSSTATNSNGSSGWAIESYYGRLNYNFDNRYLLTATLRSDGSSSFGPKNRWGTFPSFALAWRINNEKFMKGTANWLSNLKLRLGWGIVGNQGAGSYAYGYIMKNTETAWGTGFYPGNYSNPELKWEETHSYNVGLDLALFNYRVELIVDAYYKDTKNLLMQASLPAYVIDSESIGMGAPWVNVGGLNNKGLEFTLNTINIQSADWTWRTGLTLSLNRNKITKLTSDSAEIFGKVGDTVYTRSKIGSPVGQFFGYNVIGMFTCEADFYERDSHGDFLLDEDGSKIPVARPSDKDGNLYPINPESIWVGDYIFEDVNKDGKIDEKDRKKIGNPNPDFTFGFNNSIQYKDFTLSFFFNGSVGNEIYNMLRQTYTDPIGWQGKVKDVVDFARIEMYDPALGNRDISNVYISNASTAKTQRITVAGKNNNDNNRVSSRFVENGSYLRLKTLSLSYNLPRDLIKRAGIQNLQVYANVQNLFTISSYKGYDPEIGAMGQNVLRMGLDNGRYPSQRIYTLGLKINL